MYLYAYLLSKISINPSDLQCHSGANHEVEMYSTGGVHQFLQSIPASASTFLREARSLSSRRTVWTMRGMSSGFVEESAFPGLLVEMIEDSEAMDVKGVGEDSR